MAAADDYPLLASWATPGEFPGSTTRTVNQCQAALDEINRLRNANEFYREILDDVLPTVYVGVKPSFTKIDGRWVRLVNEQKEP